MRAHRHTLIAAAAVGVAALLTACSSASGPKGPTASEDAAHYDSIAGALLTQGSASSDVQAEFVEILNGVIADGVLPTRVSTTVNGNAATWYADYANLVDSAEADSIEIIMLWSSTSADSIVLVGFVDAQFIAMEDLVTGGNVDDASGATVTGSFGTPSGSCSFTTISNVFAEYPDYDPSQSTCQHESATGTISATFGTSGTVTDSIQTIAVASQTVAGVRIQFTSSAAFSSAVAKIPTSGTAATAGSRVWFGRR